MRKNTEYDMSQMLHDAVVRIAQNQGKLHARRATYFDKMWEAREREMDLTQKRREDYVRRYRPIRTFTPEERAARLEAIYDKAADMGIISRPYWGRDIDP